MKNYTIQSGTTPAPERFRITIMDNGPYMMYGKPPLKQQFLMPDEQGQNWNFKAGESFPCDKEPTALCRCGASKKHPYCDGSHTAAPWNPQLTAPIEPLLEGAELFPGPVVSLSDNEKYCAFARVCDAKGRVWNRVSGADADSVDVVVHEANHCPAGRLSAWDNATQKPYELQTEPSLGLIEDPGIRSSGPL